LNVSISVSDQIIMYGEGWEFGEVANCARGVNGSQPNLGGSGIGSFNDRIREPSVGGGPFGDPRIQGFTTGLFFAPWPADHPEIDQVPSLSPETNTNIFLRMSLNYRVI
jgi:hypothetical protein